MTTLLKVKNYLNITVSTYDAVLTTLISNLESFIKAYTEREFTEEERTEYHDGGEREIFLKNYPVKDGTVTISYNNSYQSNPNWVEIDSRNYSINYTNGIITSNTFIKGIQNIKVVYTAGYSTIPDDLELLTKELVAKEFEQRKAQGKSRETLGGASIDWKAQFTPMQKMILDKYKRTA